MKDVVLAGGCFWGMEELFRKLPGVLDTEVGYCGGLLKNPTYREVKTGTTGHAESLRLVYDPEKISLQKIIHFFFSVHDPTTQDRQGNDRGTQYRSVIFFANEEERSLALAVMQEIARLKIWKDPIVTELLPASPFYKAEEDHQDYLQKFPEGYTCHFPRYDASVIWEKA